MKAEVIEKGLHSCKVKIEGSVTSNTSAELDGFLHSVIKDSAPEQIELDFEGVDYISSTGLRVLLKLRKIGISLLVTNTSAEVYEIFDITGFTAMFEVRRKLRELDVSNCEVIGCGANGIVYRIDQETILKLYTKSNDIEEVRSEQQHARYAIQVGVPTAIPFDVVKVGNRYGSVFELIDAKSIASIMGENLDQALGYVKPYVDLLKSVHSIPYKKDNDSILTDAAAKFKGYVQDIEKSRLYDQLFPSLWKFADGIPESNTILHGDCQPGNVMVTDDELLFIDMDTLSFGNPLYDLGYLYSTMITYNKIPTMKNVVHIPVESSLEYWTQMFEVYYGDRTEEERESLKAMCKIISYTQVLRYMIRHPERSLTELNQTICDRLIGLLAGNSNFN